MRETTKEAESRGLSNARDTSAALELFLEKDAVQLFAGYGVLSERELRSKIDIKLEAYAKIKEIEFRTGINMVNTMILPALTRHIAQVAGAAAGIKAAGISQNSLQQEVSSLENLFAEIKQRVRDLENVLTECENTADPHRKAHLFADKGARVLNDLRGIVDTAEESTADDLWPLAKYQKILSVL